MDCQEFSALSAEDGDHFSVLQSDSYILTSNHVLHALTHVR